MPQTGSRLHRARSNHPTRPTSPVSLSRLLAGAVLLAAAGALYAADSGEEYHAAVAACKAAPKTGTRYVLVTAALMRPVPRSEAGLVSRVPIATAVQVECELNGWVRGHTDGNSPAVGWIRADLLQAQAPTLDSLAQAHAAAAPELRKTLAERAVALAPYQRRSHQLLIDTLQSAGDVEGARQASAMRDRLLDPQGERLGGEPRLLFVVHRGYAAPIARLGEDGRYLEPDLDTATSTLKPRRGLHFFRSGGADGVAQVLDEGSLDVSGEAPVRVAPMTARADEVNGLATNFPAAGDKTRADAAVPAAARKAAETALRAAMQQQKVDRAQIDRAFKARPDGDRQRDGLQLHSFDAGAAGAVTVATMVWDLPSPDPQSVETTVDALAIVESDGKGGYRVVARQGGQSGGDSMESHRYFDRLDLDGDGLPELIFQVGQYEGVSYQIWSRKSGQWKAVYKGGYVGV